MNPILRTFILVLCFCALAVRASGVHLHVSLDADEPPHALHVADFGAHHDHGDAYPHSATDAHHGHSHHDGHQDIEVNLDDQALSKKLGGDFDAGALIAAALLLFLVSTPLDVPLTRRRQSRVGFKPVFHLRPPLRGPPLHA